VINVNKLLIDGMITDSHIHYVHSKHKDQVKEYIISFDNGIQAKLQQSLKNKMNNKGDVLNVRF